MRIYLDNCCFNRPFDDQTRMRVRLETEAKLRIQADIRAGRHELVWSYVLDLENGANPYEEKRNSIAPWKKIARCHCSASPGVLAAGSAIMERGVGPKDALHVACAVLSGCECFITTDDKLAGKKLKEIAILNPIDFVRREERP